MAYKSPEFEKFVLEKIKEFNTPGLSLAVVQGDEIWSKVSKPARTSVLCLYMSGIWVFETTRH